MLISYYIYDMYIYIYKQTIWYLQLRKSIVPWPRLQVEDNHLFGEDAEIAEGATEKIITGDFHREFPCFLCWEFLSYGWLVVGKLPYFLCYIGIM